MASQAGFSPIPDATRSELMDYLGYWSLQRKPFAGPHGAFFFAGQPQREAIAGFSYLMAQRRRSSSLVAMPGCGATTLLQYIQRMRGFGDQAAEFVLTRGDQTSIAVIRDDLCRALGYSSSDHESETLLRRALLASQKQRVPLIWLIDGCRAPAAHVANQLLAQSDAISVVCVTGRNDQGNRGMSLVCGDMQIELPALSLSDTMAYVSEGVSNAGGRHPLFSDDAAVRLHEMTGGVLAKLAVTAESSLALAASHRLREVTPAVVEAIEQQGQSRHAA